MHSTNQSIITKPAINPISRDEVKLRLRIQHDLDNDVVDSLITEGVQYVEKYTNRALITQTRSLSYDCFPNAASIELRNGPIQFISEVELRLADGTTEVIYQPFPADVAIGTDHYYLTDASNRGALTLLNHKTWDDRELIPKEGIHIQYVCGYGDNADDVPQPIIGAIVEYVRHFYHNNGEGQLPESVKKSLNQYKLINFIL